MNIQTTLSKNLFLEGKYLPIAYIIMLLVIFILPFFSVEEYSIMRNTTSQLGSQDSPNAWVMNTVFALLGISAMIDGWRYMSGYWLHKLAIIVFGLSLVMVAFFQHAPIIPDASFSVYEDNMHSTFATITGFSFVFLAVSAGFIEASRKRQILAFSIAVIAGLLSWLIFNIEELAGVWQRLMFIIMFAWLMYFLYSHNEAIDTRL